MFEDLACNQRQRRNYNQHPIFGPGNLHVYGRYVRNGESMLAPSTRFSAVKLELDSTQSTHISTEFNAELTFPDSSFLSIEQWIKSSRTFRGTLVGGILRPGARLGNGLEFTFSQQSVDPELTPDQKDPEQELRASRLSDETDWKRQFQIPKSRDFPSATGLDVSLRSSIDFDIRRGLERLESMEGVQSLDDYETNLKQRENRLIQLSRTLLWEQKQWRERRTPDLKSAADTLGSQWRLETQLESQLERQKAWGRCEDDALKRANLAERERILQAGVEQLKWTQMNWFWFKKCARLEERLKQANKDIQGLKARRERVKKEPRIAVGKGQVKESVSLGEEAKRIGIAMKESKESALPSGDAETVFEFLNEDDRDLPDALELFRRSSG